jgi:hypothetical protein
MFSFPFNGEGETGLCGEQVSTFALGLCSGNVVAVVAVMPSIPCQETKLPVGNQMACPHPWSPQTRVFFVVPSAQATARFLMPGKTLGGFPIGGVIMCMWIVLFVTIFALEIIARISSRNQYRLEDAGAEYTFQSHEGSRYAVGGDGSL